MKLKNIKIENFRGIKSLDLPLDGLVVLIGENNVGKSTILEALKLALTRGLGVNFNARFTEYDFYLENEASTPLSAPPICLTLHFQEDGDGDWSEAITQQLDEVIQLDVVNNINSITLQVTGIYDSALGGFKTTWSFLDNNSNELALRKNTPHSILLKLVPLFFLSAIRNASQEFGQRGQFWNSFLKTIELPDDQRQAIEESLQQINTSIIQSNAGLLQVTQKISDAKKLVPLSSSDPVVLEALPTRLFDMVGKIQVHLKSCSGAKLPLNRHGEGTQSLAVLMLFEAFTVANLVEAYSSDSVPLLALEEPEAHLHPSAIRALGSFLQDLSGQTIVTSHSGDLISRIPIEAIRRLYKHNGETKVGYVAPNIFTDRELQAINYNVCLSKGHYLFSRCWLFVEGESDYHLLPFLFEILGYSLDEVSFSIIEISQVIDKGEPLVKLAKTLGIQWFLMADGDAAGLGYITRMQKHLDPGKNIQDRARALSHNDIEHEFWHAGFQGFIENFITTPQRQEASRQAAGDPAKELKLKIRAAIKTSGGKPAFAQALASEIERRGANSIPQTIKDILGLVVQMSGD